MVAKCNIGDRLRSEHVIVIVIEKTNEFIENFFEVNENSSHPYNVWEAFKCAFRDYAIKIGSWKQKKCI